MTIEIHASMEAQWHEYAMDLDIHGFIRIPGVVESADDAETIRSWIRESVRGYDVSMGNRRVSS